MPAFRITTLQGAIGSFCSATGTLMLVAPHQFAASTYAALQPNLTGWGILFLLTGLTMIGVAALAPRRPWVVAAHTAAGAALLLLAGGGFVAARAWSGLVMYLALGIGTVAAPLLVCRGRRTPEADECGDLLTATLGAGAMALGLVLLTIPAQFGAAVYDTVRPALTGIGLAFVAGGLVTLAGEVTPALPRPLVWAGQGLTAALFLGWMASVSLPNRLWTGMLLYGGGGLLLAAAPWTRRHGLSLDPRSLQTRLALMLAAAAALPLIAGVALDGARDERRVIDLALARQELLAATLALAGEQAPDHLADLVANASRAGGDEILLVDRAGVTLARAPAATGSATGASVTPPVAALLAGATGPGTLTYAGPDGPRLAAYAPLPRAGGGLVVEQPLDRALTEVRGDREDAFSLLLLAAMSAAAVGVLVAGRLVAPLGHLGRAVEDLDAIEATVALPRAGVTEVRRLTDGVGALRARLAARTAERARAEAAVRLLAEAGHLLATSLDEAATLRAVARLAVPSLADGCSVHVVQEDGTVRQVAVAHVDPAKEEQLRRLRERHPIDPDGPHPIAGVLRTGRPSLRPELSDEMQRPAYPDPEQWAMARALTFRSGMTVPMAARGRFVGVYSFFITESARRYGPEELALAEDLARRAALAVDNARLYRQAQAAIRAREEFLGIASHELRTPLTSVKGYVQLLDRQVRRAGASRDHLLHLIDPLGRQVSRLEELVADLLDVTRLQQGQLELRLEPVELGELARAVVARLAHSDGHALPHTLIVDAPAPVHGRWDASRLDQALTNLVSNAIKYSPAGGEVRVVVRRDGAGAAVAVHDQGLGIGPEERARLFQPFSRGAATERAIQGVGLGLYITAQVIKRHGGTITVASRPGAGSVFTVHLPPELPR